MLDMQTYPLKDNSYMAVFCWTYGGKEIVKTKIHAHDADARHWLKLTLKKEILDFMSRYTNHRILAYGTMITAAQREAIDYIRLHFVNAEKSSFKIEKLLLSIRQNWQHFKTLVPSDESRYKCYQIALEDIDLLIEKSLTKTQPSS